MQKKRKYCEILLGCAIFLIYILFFIICVNLSTRCEIYFGESHLRGKAKMYYADEYYNISENNSVSENIETDVAVLNLPVFHMNNIVFRFDPINVQENFSIERIKLSWLGLMEYDLTGEELLGYISSFGDCEGIVQGENAYFTVSTSDPRLELSRDFTKLIIKNIVFIQYILLVILLLVYIAIRFVVEHIGKSNRNNRYIYGIIVILIDIIVCMGFILNYVMRYLIEHFDNVSWGQLLYHLHTPLDGTNTSSFNDIIIAILSLIGIVSIIVVGISILLRNVVKGVKSFFLWCIIFGMASSGYAVYQLNNHFGLKEYYEYIKQESNIYDEYYVDGRDIEIIFPEKKRNLIYIFLESMETTYTDKSVGGAFDVNIIPELTELSIDNIDFSNDGINGGYVLPGTEFTMGGLVAQTSGVPINETLVSNDTLNATWESDNNYLPGAWTIGDVLEENGYNQEFMIGSDGKFAGRSSYFRGHGDYEIVDYISAMEEGRIPDGYRVWWGYEDEKLFAFAKEDILKLAANDKPFNFTMLTVDTHFTDGYICPLCEDKYESQYSNVLACSSRQVAGFVDWVKQQDFYSNTTIVIAGDHTTMDSAYIEKEGAKSYDRKIYCTIINPSEGCVESDETRIFSTLDLYPTTLAGLGVSIEGNRLGLGVNLFSDEPTLIEQFGKEYVKTELIKNSNYYTQNLLYGRNKKNQIP